MDAFDYAYRRTYGLIMAPDGDPRAPGGAVTVGLCGSWDHPGPCRWPHYSTIARAKNGGYTLTVEFDCPPDELTEVTTRIDEALARGELLGPDGRLTRWSMGQAAVKHRDRS